MGGVDETRQAAAAMGLALVGYGDGVEVWPEHVQAVEVFACLLTQWRLAPMGGVVGLDYTAIPAVLTMLAVPQADWAGLLMQIRVMESAAVKELNA